MDSKDLVIETEIEKITKLVRSLNDGELECNHTLSPEAVCYAKEIQNIIEKKHNACVTIFANNLNINWYYD